MLKVCILYFGNTPLFSETKDYHKQMIEYYSKSFDVHTFCIFDKDSEQESIQKVLQPEQTIILEKDEISRMCKCLKKHPSYKKNLEYLNSLEPITMCRKEHNELKEENIAWCLSLKKGIKMVEEYEQKNNLIFDIFIFVKYDFIINNYYDLPTLKKNSTFGDVLTCQNETNIQEFTKALEHYNLKTDTEYLDLLKELKIDRYAGRIYTKHMKTLNFGSAYVKNYETIQKIYNNCLNNITTKNTVYLCDDNFMLTRRENINKFKYLISSFGQLKLDDACGNFIFSLEYQTVAFCMKNDLLPIIYSNRNQGTYRKELNIMNKHFVPNNKRVIIQGKRCEKINNLYYFREVNDVKLRYSVDYAYVGEKLNLSFDVEVKSPITMFIKFFDFTNSLAYVEPVVQIKPGHVSYDTQLKINDKFYIQLEFSGLEDKQMKISDVEITQEELILHYLTFITEGDLYEGAYDLSKCDEMLKQLTDKYVDKYHCVRYRDLDNLEEKKYITTVRTDKLQTGGNNVNSEKIAFFKWKPYIIYKYLSQLPPNHILIYRDGNVEKYRNYLISFENIKSECTKILFTVPQKLWFMHENQGIKSCSHQKKYLTKAMKINQNEFFLSHDLVNAATVIGQNTPWTLEFMKKWVDNCVSDAFINHEYIENEHFMYKWHCNDQAVLNALIISMKQNNELELEYPYYLNFDRELTFTKCEDVRKSKNYDGFILNKMQQVLSVPHFSHGSRLVRNSDSSLNFIRTPEVKYEPCQWVGYEVITPGTYVVSFEIKFKKFIPTNEKELLIGLKTHFPVRCYNDWIHNCKVNEYYPVHISIDKPTEELDLYILIFDNAKPLLEFDLQNFYITKIK